LILEDQGVGAHRKSRRIALALDPPNLPERRSDAGLRDETASRLSDDRPYGAALEPRPELRRLARYYVLSIEPTLFAKHTLIRRWGRIGSLGRERLRFFGDDDGSQAQVTLETWLARKRKRGYTPRSEPSRPAYSFRSAAKFTDPTTQICHKKLRALTECGTVLQNPLQCGDHLLEHYLD
jgi:predicted DNA-binding WGR domain protein